MLSNIKFIRLKKGLKAKDVAQKLNLSPSYISLLENGQRTPTQEILQKLAHLYDVQPRELL